MVSRTKTVTILGKGFSKASGEYQETSSEKSGTVLKELQHQKAKPKHGNCDSREEFGIDRQASTSIFPESHVNLIFRKLISLPIFLR